MNNQIEPREALNMLDEVSSIANVNRKTHANVVRAIQSLGMLVTRYEEDQKRAIEKAAKMTDKERSEK